MFWEPDVEWIVDAVDDRMSEGRGAQGIADPKLPGLIKALGPIKKPPRPKFQAKSKPKK